MTKNTTNPMPKTATKKSIKPTEILAPKTSFKINDFCLTPVELKRTTDPTTLPNSTDNVPSSVTSITTPVDYTFGQQRAVQAIRTALDIRANGYHIFAAGENGLGKRTLITRLLSDYSNSNFNQDNHSTPRATPDDWLYVYNFKDARSPQALSLPAGRGQDFADTMHQMWAVAKKQLNKRFRSDHYQSKVEAIKNQISLKEEQAYSALHEESRQLSLTLALRATDNKPIFVESFDDELSDDLEENLSENLNDGLDKNLSKNNALIKDNAKNATNPATKNKSSQKSQPLATKTSPHIKTLSIKTSLTAKNNATGKSKEKGTKDTLPSPYIPNFQDKNHMQKRLSLLTITLEQIEDEANQTLQSLHHSLTRRTLKPLFEPLFQKYAEFPAISQYLNAVHDDIVLHVERIVNEDDDEFLPSYFSPVPARYFVNVMAAHTPNSGVPIVFEDLPTHLNLLGHVEQVTHLGTVSTDVSLIRAGSLHRANGGYLILEASHLLEYPYAWQGLKRALQSRQIKMSSLEQMLTLTGSISLEPQPIALDVKVILLGQPDLYYDLLEFEPEFNTVFKIRADFHDRVARTPANEQAMVAKIADMVTKYQLLPFDSTALSRLLEYLSEQAEDQNELSLHGDRLVQLLHESNRHALLEHVKIVSKTHVNQAISEIQHRSGYLRQLFWQEIEKGQQLISTTGEAIGQVNALTVISYADSEFGMPARLTATVHHSMGNADILDIERDVNLGGSLHAKGVLIMSSYLRALFAQNHPLNFTASLAFEQSYGGIDGDSATIAETCALLSALAQVPIKQHLAVTGSMNQFGQVQAVGGINAKIAGFYDTCVEQGLITNDGQTSEMATQGVIIPKANIAQLMLRQDIIDSVKRGNFAIYAIEHVNEALFLLTGMVANKLNKKGVYRKKSLYGKIVRRLQAWDEKEGKG